jgi:hypothetical protein
MLSGSRSEEYMLIAIGQLRYAPFLADWMAFKDDLRKIVEKQPGWTVAKPGPRNGEMEGWCRLDRSSDAENAYGTQKQAFNLYQTNHMIQPTILIKGASWSTCSKRPGTVGITPCSSVTAVPISRMSLRADIRPSGLG